MECACHEELDPLAVAAVGVGGRPLAGADAGDRPGGGGAAEQLHPRAAAVVRGAGGSEGPPGSPGAGVRLPRRRPPGRWTGGGDPGKDGFGQHRSINLRIIETPSGRMILPLGNMQTFIIFYKDIYLSIHK